MPMRTWAHHTVFTPRRMVICRWQWARLQRWPRRSIALRCNRIWIAIAGSPGATQYWLDRLIPVDYWCAPVMTWAELLAHDGFKTLGFLQDVVRGNGARVRTTSCPIRFDGIRPQAARAAPKVAEDNAWVEANSLAD